jgi:hypothetical protein
LIAVSKPSSSSLIGRLNSVRVLSSSPTVAWTSSHTFLVAGPPVMAEAVQRALDEAEVKGENVIAERFSGY